MRWFAILLFALTACDEEQAAAPDPVRMTEEAVSHYCLMRIGEHGGPKAQVHLEGGLAPIFFAQARDELAYLRSAERTAPITALYVSDMGEAASWEEPGPDNWILAEMAVFVVGADVTGGMGAPEIAPFGDADAASEFAASHGGEIMALDMIPDDALLAPIDITLPGELTQ